LIKPAGLAGHQSDEWGFGKSTWGRKNFSAGLVAGVGFGELKPTRQVITD
jgi:hypothetical protein